MDNVYVCGVCGYEYKYEGALPDNFICPVCGAGKDSFTQQK